MQSATADVNQAVVTTRQMFQSAYRARNMTDVRTAISILNQILPTEKKLIFDSELYYDSIKVKQVIVCTNDNCGNDIQLQENNFVYTVHSAGLGRWDKLHNSQIVTRRLKCSSCSKLIDVSKVDIMESAKNEYTVGQFVPAEPSISNVFESSLNAAHFWDWARLVMGKLENQFREFREQFSVDRQDSTEGLM